MNDALLQVGIGKRDVQMQAAALQRIRDFARVVAGQGDERRLTRRLHGADFGDRDLEVRQNLEQQRLELMVRLVDLIEQQHATVLFAKGLQQRSRLEEFLREEDVPELVEAGDRLLESARTLQHLIERFFQHLRVE